MGLLQDKDVSVVWKINGKYALHPVVLELGAEFTDFSLTSPFGKNTLISWWDYIVMDPKVSMKSVHWCWQVRL
jgi:hypothetical protein